MFKGYQLIALCLIVAGIMTFLITWNTPEFWSYTYHGQFTKTDGFFITSLLSASGLSLFLKN